jgi:hypothetical protein
MAPEQACIWVFPYRCEHYYRVSFALPDTVREGLELGARNHWEAVIRHLEDLIGSHRGVTT